jgi:hypothetical protein
MFGKVLVRKYPNRYLRKVVETIVTAFYSQSFFRNYLSKQKQRYSSHFNQGIYTLSFDCDYEKDIQALPKLLDILGKYSIRTSIASVGRWIEKYPDIHKRILDEGHEIINHTYSHPNNEELNPSKRMIDLPYEEQKREIMRCHEVCLDLLGYAPVGFRTPHFGQLHSETIYFILKEVGYRYSSSTAAICTRGFGAPYLIHGVIEIPVSSSVDYPFAVFDTWNMLQGPRARLKTSEAFLDCFYRTLEEVARTRTYITHYFDPYEIIREKKLEKMGSYLANRGGLSITPYIDLLGMIS